VTKVLYIEHDDDNRYMLKMRLERADDFEVIVSDNSEQGYRLAATERPDVILMDLVLFESRLRRRHHPGSRWFQSAWPLSRLAGLSC
jgi:DNA-binding response OmpR family regulator